MSDYTTNASVVLQMNGEEPKKVLDDLRTRAHNLENAIAKAASQGNKVELGKLRKELKTTQRQIRECESATQQVESVLQQLDKATPKNLQRTLRTLEKQLNNLERGSVEWKRQTEYIKRVRSEIDKVNRELREGETFWERFNRRMNDWQTTIATAAAAITGLIMAGRSAVSAFAEMDAEMANVRKFTGMTADEVKTLNQEFLKIDTRTSREELNKLAQEAGRLGKSSQEDVLGFVKAADQINVALDDLGEGATLTLSKLTSIFGDEERLGTERSLLAVGSVINELSQNCTASAGYLAQFAQRLAGVGAQAGMTIPQIMAFAAVLDSQGQAVEMSATAMSQLIMSLFKETEKIAKATGMDLEKFRETLNRSTNEGLLMLLDQLHQLGGMDVLAPVFSAMGENGARASAVISALAGNVEMVRWEQVEANKAFQEATSVTKEFTVQNTTVQAGLDKAKKRLRELAIELGEKLAPVMRHVISSTTLTLKALSFMVDFFSKYKKEIIAAVVAFTAYKAIMLVYTSHTIMAQKATLLFHGAMKLVHGIVPAVRLLFTPLVNAVQYFTNGLQVNYTMQQRWRNSLKAMKFSSWVGMVMALGAAIYSVANRINEAKRAAEEAQREQEEFRKKIVDLDEASAEYCANEVARLDALYNSATDEAKSVDERKAAAVRLQSIYPDYFKNLSMEEIMVGKAKSAYDQLRDSIIEVARAKAAAEKIQENEKELLTLEQQEPKLRERRDSDKIAYDNAVAEWESAQQQQNYTPYNNPTEAAFGYMANVAPSASEVSSTSRAYNASEAALQANLTKQQQLKEANTFLQEKYKISADALFQDTTTLPPITPTPLPIETKGDKFSAEKDWRKQEEASARISYATGKTDYIAYTKRMNEIAVEFCERQLLHTDLTESERLEITANWREEQLMEQQFCDAQTIEEEKIAHSDRLAELKQFYIDGQISKETYDNRVEEEELYHQFNLIALTKEGSRERLEAEERYANLQIQQMQRRQQETKKLEEKYDAMKKEYFGDNINERQAAYDTMLANLKLVYEAEIKAVGDNATEKLRINEAYQKAKLALQKKYGLLIEEDNRNRLEKANEEFLEWLQTDAGKAVTGTFETVMSGMSAIFSQVSSLVQSELQIQTSAIEKRYEKEISLAEGNTYQIKRIEKQKEAEIAKAKNEANKKLFAMQVIQAIAQTAQNAISAYGSAAAIPVVGFVLAPIAAAMAIAAGALQIAAIKKQQQASQAQGYSQGGFTKPGAVDEPAGIVHAGEWVASQKLLANPVARPLINSLDYAQRTNTIGSLRASDVSRSMTAPITLAQQPAPQVVVQQTPPQVIVEQNSEYADTMRQLASRLNEPFVTINTVTGDAGIKKAQEDYDKLIRNKSPKFRK